MVSRRRLPGLVIGVGLLLSGVSLAASRAGGEAGRRLPSSYEGSVTVYSADWCGACKRLQQDLRDRQIPFDAIDVDRNPSAHQRARQATGTSAIPVTSVDRGGGDTVWIVGANIGAVERAYRGRLPMTAGGRQRLGGSSMLRARLAALLSLIALLLAAVMQGRGYVRCAMDGSLHLVACCQVAPWLDGQAFDDPACCEQLTNPSLAPAGPRVSPLLDLAALPPALTLPGVRAPLPDRVVFPPPVAPPPPARAGPPPPPIARRLAALSRLLS